jgi:hypothetical protein
MVYAAIDIHKRAFQAAVLDPDTGEVVEERFSADRESRARWAEQWRGRDSSKRTRCARERRKRSEPHPHPPHRRTR